MFSGVVACVPFVTVDGRKGCHNCVGVVTSGMGVVTLALCFCMSCGICKAMCDGSPND